MSDATPKPIAIPPSAGGTIAATIAGILVARTISILFQGDAALGTADWLLPLGLIAYVVMVVNSTQKLRARLGVQATPESIRRQWLVVGGGGLIGFVLGLVGVNVIV